MLTTKIRMVTLATSAGIEFSVAVDRACGEDVRSGQLQWKQAAGNRPIDCLDMTGTAIQLCIVFACLELDTSILMYLRMQHRLAALFVVSVCWTEAVGVGSTWQIGSLQIPTTGPQHSTPQAAFLTPSEGNTTGPARDDYIELRL